LRLHGEEIAVDCLSIRDRTWSPRDDLSDTIMGTAVSGAYTHAMASPTEGFHALSATFDGACRVVAGYLVRDGVVADVVGGERRVVERRGGRPSAVTITVEDREGRRLEAEGRLHNAFAGEDHDNWSNKGWRAFRRFTR
jgi:hypothetical protein